MVARGTRASRAAVVVAAAFVAACGPGRGFDEGFDGGFVDDAADASDGAMDAAMDADVTDVVRAAMDVQPVACPPYDAAVSASDGGGAPLVGLAAGAMFTCGLAGDGTARCWGANTHGQLGDGTVDAQGRALPAPVTGLSGATQLAAGDEHACALLGDGTVVCWGRNQYGQLGDGTMTDRATPAPVTGLSGATRVAAGAGFTCALTAAGARCWGHDASGQLADGTTTDRATPVAVGALDTASALALGTTHACGVFADGSARCWGDAAFGQLGDCATDARHAPVTVHGLASGVVDVAVGLRHGCAVTMDGAVRCWGDDLEGEVGVDAYVSDPCEAAMEDGNVHGAVAVPGITGAAAVALGEGSSCARTSDGAVWCWGQNRYGQLGDCTPDGRAVPSRVAGLPGAVELVSGALHACVRAADGSAWCFGDNEVGQLGDGTRANRATPARVAW